MEIPPIYVDEKTGYTESKDSYITFLNHFVKKPTRPTISQVAESSGYAETTVERWFHTNKYIDRYNQYHTQLHKETTNNKIDELKTMNDLLINRIKTTINTGTGLTNKQENTMRTYSNTDELNLEKLDITDKKYHIIKQDQKENELSTLRTQEMIKNTIETDQKLTQEQDTRTILEEALERNNKPRFQENIETAQQMYEEYEDEEY